MRREHEYESTRQTATQPKRSMHTSVYDALDVVHPYHTGRLCGKAIEVKVIEFLPTHFCSIVDPVRTIIIQLSSSRQAKEVPPALLASLPASLSVSLPRSLLFHYLVHFLLYYLLHFLVPILYYCWRKTLALYKASSFKQKAMNLVTTCIAKQPRR